jgi:hypothetical protein
MAFRCFTRFVAIAAAVSVSVIISGCASTQLNYNTLDLAESVSDIQTKQVLHNLSLFLDDPSALPTHIDLTSGTAQTSNVIQPTVTYPLGASWVNQAVGALGKNAGLTQEIQSTRAGPGLSLEGQNTQQQNWNYQPIIDGEELLRLRALYRYAIGVEVMPFTFPSENSSTVPCYALPECQSYSGEYLKRDYPIVRKSVTTTYSNLKPDDSIYCPNIGVKSWVVPTSKQGQQPQPPVPQEASCSTMSTTVQTPDENTLHYPNCILCLKKGKYFGAFVSRGGSDRNRETILSSQLEVNHLLRKLRGENGHRWLRYVGDKFPVGYDPTTDEYLGYYEGHLLFVARNERWKLSEFTLFVLTATAQSSSAAAANSGGGGGSSKKGGGGAGGGMTPSSIAPTQQLF